MDRRNSAGLMTETLSDVIRLRGLRPDPNALAEQFFAFIYGLYLRWCTSDRRNIERVREAAVRFLETTLGNLSKL